MNIFEKWNKEIDTKKLAEEVKQVEQNGSGEYEETPYGKYIVSVEKMELKESKSGKPMLSVWFDIKEGEYKGRKIFMNQLVEQPFQIHIANEFLRSLDSGVDVDFDGNFEHYNNTILDVHEAIDGKIEYLLGYSQNAKGYNVFEIEEVYDA